MHVLLRATSRSTQEFQTPIRFGVVNDVEAVCARNGLKFPRAGLCMQMNTLGPGKLSAGLFVLVVIIISNIVPQAFWFTLVTGEDILNSGHGSTTGGAGLRHFDFPPPPQLGVSAGLADQGTYSVAICLRHGRHTSIAGLVIEPQEF
jgi:hypothetical protein